MARFIDAPQSVRCGRTITLRDNSAAQCGRRAKRGGLCAQHFGIAFLGRIARLNGGKLSKPWRRAALQIHHRFPVYHAREVLLILQLREKVK